MERRLIPDRVVCDRYHVHNSTLGNWEKRLGFPPPVRINNRKYRDEAELAKFDEARAAERNTTAA
jgi:hypothetical protein